MPKEIAEQSPDWEAILRAHQMRVTKPRLLVINDLWTHPHSGTEEVLARLRQQLPTASLQTVHNVLADLRSIGLLKSLELPGQPDRFEIDNGDNHHHLVCSNCRRIVDVPCAVGHTPCLQPSHDHGMQVWFADVIYRGICPACLAKQAKIVPSPLAAKPSDQLT